MILAQFKEILHTHGIVSFPSQGHSFNPEYHEAIEIVETCDEPDGRILQEFTKGYQSDSRIIRPARVKVAKHPPLDAPTLQNKKEEVCEEGENCKDVKQKEDV